MAEAVMSKSNMFSLCASSDLSSSSIFHHQNQHTISTLPHIISGIGFPSLKLTPLPLSRSSSYSDFLGRRVVVKGIPRMGNSQPQMSIGIGKAQKWWEKGLQPNMKEVKGAQDFVESLLNAEDKLVVVDFFSPGCGGCKALHPKICQLAEMNPDVEFLQVNYEEHKSMCYTLNIHVLPFFRFYRGAQGRLCSFSCTNATIKKFKDALAKHSPDRCSLRPTKGLEEKELVALAANKDLSFIYTRKTEKPLPIPSQEKILAEAPSPSTTSPASDSNSEPPLPLPIPLPLPHPLPLSSSSTRSKTVQASEDKSLVTSPR